MAKYKDPYWAGDEADSWIETDFIPREAARCLMYHNQGPLTEYDLNDLPAADVRPVVFCKDCANSRKSDVDGAIYCPIWDRWEMPEYGFCYEGRIGKDG